MAGTVGITAVTTHTRITEAAAPIILTGYIIAAHLADTIATDTIITHAITAQDTIMVVIIRKVTTEAAVVDIIVVTEIMMSERGLV